MVLDKSWNITIYRGVKVEFDPKSQSLQNWSGLIPKRKLITWYIKISESFKVLLKKSLF